MKVTFKTSNLKVKSIGSGNWVLMEPMVAEIEDNGVMRLVVVPANYETDFESVPKALVIAYVLIKGTARMSATLHDYLCDVHKLPEKYPAALTLLGMAPPRKWLDEAFYEAMKTEGTPWYSRELAYAGVSLYSATFGR